MLTRRTVLTSGLTLGTFAVFTTRFALGQQMTKEEVFNDKDAPVLGNAKGDVTIVEYT